MRNLKEDFIKKAKKTHGGDKYDYSQIEYRDNKTSVKIYCKKCKMFFYQKPYNHTKSSGCQSCAKNKKSNTEDFIEKASKIKKHKNKYDYSLVKYKNMHTVVKIVCKKHGVVFEQTPINHLQGKCGCRSCFSNEKLTTEEFIKKSKKINKKKFNYDLTVYKNSKTKVKLKCNEHNYIFEQNPNNHLSKKHDCPLCGNKKRRLSRIKEISINKFNGNQIIPSFNPVACEIFDKISQKNNTHIQHAMNGGEYYIEEVGYWLDGYDKENNVAYEFDEKHHFDKNGILLKSDVIRQNEIKKFLKCEFIRIKF